MITNANIKLSEGKNKESVFFTQGTVKKENDSFYIEYELDNNRYIIGISGGIITITRTAEESYTMVFQKGQAHSFDMAMPFGSLRMLLTPSKADFESSDSGINLALCYSLSLHGELKKEAQSFELYVDCKYKNN